MESYSPFPKEVPYFSTTAARTLLLYRPDAGFLFQCHRSGFASGPVLQSFDAMQIEPPEIFPDSGSGDAILFAGLTDREVSNFDWQHELETSKDIWILVHLFYLDHRRGQGMLGLSFLALGRFSCYITDIS